MTYFIVEWLVSSTFIWDLFPSTGTMIDYYRRVLHNKVVAYIKLGKTPPGESWHTYEDL